MRYTFLELCKEGEILLWCVGVEWQFRHNTVFVHKGRGDSYDKTANTFSSFFHLNTSLWLSGHCHHNCQHMIEDSSVGNQRKSWTTQSITLSTAKAPPWLCFPLTHGKVAKLSNQLLLTCCGNYFTSEGIILCKMLPWWNLTFYNTLKATVIHRRFNKQNNANKKK